MSSVIRVVIVDDHELLRAGLRARLQSLSDIEFAGEAGTAAEGMKLLEQTLADVVVLDVQLPDESGIETARRIKARWPALKILILTGNTPIAVAHDAMQAGADGFLRKEDAAADLDRAIRVVASGKTYLSPDAASALAAALRAPPPAVDEAPAGPALTERELSVLKGVAEGLSYKEIAAALDVSVKSVETYRARIARKLGVTSRAEMVRYAVRRGLVAP